MKRKKNVRQRGGKTHGWGAMKKHRGAGNRGGRGNAGSGKRSDHKKPSFWDNRAPQRSKQKVGQDYFGKHGFHSITRTHITAINVRQLDQFIPLWVAEKKAVKSGTNYTVDLTKLGYDKLLGSGKITKNVRVTISTATPGAVEKIAAAGGAVETAVAAITE